MGLLQWKGTRWVVLGALVAVAAPVVVSGIAGKRGEASRPAVQVAQKQDQGRPVQPTPEILSLQESFVRIAQQVKPAVVNISTIHVEKFTAPEYEFYFGSPFEDFFDDFFGGQQKQKKQPQPRERSYQRRYEGIGSGVIIDPEGYILTNEHVVRGAKEIRVTMSDEKKYTGKVIGQDARTDLAVVRIKAEGKLPFAKLGDSDAIRVGDWAVAIGSPFGLEETVTAGIISAVRQSLLIEDRDYRDLLQTDAAINRGNSGGPLCNINGEIIGVNTAIYAPTGVFTGIGFAIPINSAKEILDDLIHKGRVVRGWLGVEIRPVDDAIARQFRLPGKQGVLINNVVKGSPAERAGLKRGDVIVGFGGQRIDDVRQLQSATSQTEPKKKVDITVIRNGKQVALQLVTGEMKPEDAEAAAPRIPREQPVPEQNTTAEWEGMQIATLDNTIARQYEIPSGTKGCVVVSVAEGTVAEETGFLPGDMILSVNGAETPTVADFQAAMRKVNLAEGVVFDVNRQGRLLYLSYSGSTK
jgi:Do/DeqQ family serine protease